MSVTREQVLHYLRHDMPAAITEASNRERVEYHETDGDMGRWPLSEVHERQRMADLCRAIDVVEAVGPEGGEDG